MVAQEGRYMCMQTADSVWQKLVQLCKATKM